MSAFNISIEDAPLEEKVSIGSAGDDAHHNDTAEGANEKTLTTSSNDNKIQDTATSINNKDTNKTIQIEDINMNNENIENDNNNDDEKNMMKMKLFATPSEEEIPSLIELKSLVAESEDMLKYSEHVSSFTSMAYLRFLRGSTNSEHAYKRILKTAQWRSEQGVNNIKYPDSFPDVINLKAITVNGKDIGGHPVVCIDCKHHDKNNRDMEQYKRYIIYLFEECCKLSPDERLSIIFDLKHFGFKSMDLEFCKFLIGTLTRHFPETLENALILDAPFLFGGFWTLIKGWLDPVTAEKVRFVDAEGIHEYINMKTLVERDRN